METKKIRTKERVNLKKIYSKNKSSIALLSMMSFGIAYLIVNNYIPMGGLIIAFKEYKYNLGMIDSPWVGLKNFTYLFKTQDAVNIIRNTVGYNLVFILLGNAFAVSIAIMLNSLKSKMGKKIYQTIILIPFLISIIVVSYIVYGFLSMDTGLINNILKTLGMQPVSWYTTSKYWPFILTFVHLWKSFGYSSIIYYATVIGIDTALYEAASIDGASYWKQVWHVTLPGMKTTIITLVLMAMGKMFYSDFGLFYQVPMRSGLLSSVTDTIDVFVYKGLTQLNDIGRSSAAGFLQSILGFIVVIIANAVVKKIDKKSALF